MPIDVSAAIAYPRPMLDILPPWPLLSAFLAASFVLAVTPGPGVFYIVTRSLWQGRRFGLASVAGVALGNLGNAVGASVGVAAVALFFAAFLPQFMRADVDPLPQSLLPSPRARPRRPLPAHARCPRWDAP